MEATTVETTTTEPTMWPTFPCWMWDRRHKCPVHVISAIGSNWIIEEFEGQYEVDFYQLTSVFPESIPPEQRCRSQYLADMDSAGFPNP